MGSTIWLLSDNSIEQGDSLDHSAIYAVLDPLDQLCATLGVLTISSFVGIPGQGRQPHLESHPQTHSVV